MYIFLSGGPVPCILVSISSKLCIIVRHGCVLCHCLAPGPATSLDVCPWGHVSSRDHRSAPTQLPLAP